jgi:hypothetical protein
MLLPKLEQGMRQILRSMGKTHKMLVSPKELTLQSSRKKEAKINLFRFRSYLMERGNNLMKEDLDVGKKGPRSVRNIAE